MANQDEFFKLHGAKELGAELKALSRGMQNKIVRPGLRQGAAEIRKVAKRIVSSELKDTGLLAKNIKSKVFTAKRGRRGVLARVGIVHDAGYYPQKGNEKKPRPVAVVAATHNIRIKFLDRATAQAQSIAIHKLLTVSQQKMDAFHAAQPKAPKQ